MQGNRVVLGFCFGGNGWLTLVSIGTSLAMGEAAVALQTSPPCPSENVARVYHPLSTKSRQGHVPTMDGPCLNAMCETMSAIIQFVGEE